MVEKVYLNGQLVIRRRAAISPFDRGFLYGYGLFELIRAYHGIPFRLERHLARLRRSAEALDLGAGLSRLNLEAACVEILKANGLQDVVDSRSGVVIRLTVSAGADEPSTAPSILTQPTVLITAQPYRPPSSRIYRCGFKAIISQFRRDSLSPLSQLLTTSFLTSYLAKQEARDERADEAILLNERGLVAEGSESNIFLVMGHILLTPPLKNGLLPGVTREATLELAAAMGIEAGEWAIKERDLFQAQEAFITSSLLEVMPLTEISSQAIGNGKPGPITRKFMAAYKRLVKKETAGGLVV